MHHSSTKTETLLGVRLSCVTWEDFERWIDNNFGRVRRWCFEPSDDGTGMGRMVIYSLPSGVHERTANTIEQLIISQILRAGNTIGTVIPRRLICVIRDYGQQPNRSLTPVDLTVGGEVLAAEGGFPFTNVVIKAAYRNDELMRLRAKLERWMDPRWTSVQVTIGIKIFADGTTPLRRVAILHQRGQSIQEVEFGLNCRHLPALVLTFPLTTVYFGVALPTALSGLDNPQVSIDLFVLRAMFETYVGREVGAQRADE